MRKITLVTITTAICLTSAFIAFRIFEPATPQTEVVETVNPETFSKYLETEINKIRGSELKHSETLCKIGKERIVYLEEFGFSHDKFNENSQEWIRENGYLLLGENLEENTYLSTRYETKYVERDISGIIANWKNSPTHYENIVDPEYNETCVVCSGAYCVQIFAESPPAKPE
jgi:uncharacterized protein YkwD